MAEDAQESLNMDKDPQIFFLNDENLKWASWVPNNRDVYYNCGYGPPARSSARAKNQRAQPSHFCVSLWFVKYELFNVS